ncbi:ANTAR domain-containing protein [Streptomyces sp. CA-132043]|uniref:ANTAR domain-containing protein n=1 Tax=Streptomyces sp. CA-132043 TaxID=3240048 RepID=UPI003D8D1984
MHNPADDQAQSRTTDFEAVFRASRSALLILDTELLIVDANPAYLKVTARSHTDLLGRRIFEAFPHHPDAARGDGAARLTASLRRVLRRAEPDAVPFLRYDIASPDRDGDLAERHWSAFTTPLRNHDGTVAALLHQVEDITPLHRDRIEGATSDAPAGASPGTSSPEEAILAHALRRLERMKQLERENTQLKSALTSRATIDQAIGILIAERRIAPDEAFQILITMSQQTNVKLRHIAASVVRRASGSVGGHPAHPAP